MSRVEDVMNQIDSLLAAAPHHNSNNGGIIGRDETLLFSPNYQKSLDESLFVFSLGKNINHEAENTVIHELLHYFLQIDIIHSAISSTKFVACFPPNMPYHRLQFLTKAISYAIFESDTTQQPSSSAPANFLTLAALTILIKYPSSIESLTILQSVLNDYIAAYPDSPNFTLRNKFVKLIEISPYFSLGLITAACSTLLVHHHEFPSQSLCCFFQICCQWLADHKDIFASLLNINNILALKETLLVSVAEAMFRFIDQFCISYEYIEDMQLIVSLFKVSHHLIDFFMMIELTANPMMNINSGVHSSQNGGTNLYGMNAKLAELAENTFSQLVAHWEQKNQVVATTTRGEQPQIATSLFAIFTQTLYFACGKGLLPSDTVIFKRVIKYLPKQLFHSSLFLKSIL